ncbi:hypothetical protein SLS62_005714 [Diatrype stigma]|uniref:Uncharacterized protein n=1 Tax=Diatrype stigma TaxID=117547 RepID=A0AAN9US96_9PEZI
MQFRSVALFLSALPAALANLPPTLELLAFQDGQRIGCVNGYGRFITNKLACCPFRAQTIDASSDSSNLWAVGYGTCSAEPGTLECYQPEGEPSAFTLNGTDLELVGTVTGIGTSFSANSKPDPEDRKGVETIVGDGGSEVFSLQVHAVSG